MKLESLFINTERRLVCPMIPNCIRFSLRRGMFLAMGGTIYISNNEYHYVIMERGKENKHYRSLDINDILYPLFEGITFSLASKYELKNRNEKEDPRKLLWGKQLELLGKIDPLFKERCQKEIDSILKIAPYKKCN